MNTTLEARLKQHASNHLLRTRLPLQGRHHTVIHHDQQKLINFSSNDYLGLSQDPKVKNAAISAIQQYGVGGTSSTLISGYTQTHQALEHEFAKTMGFEDALLFNSGYHANLGVISTFTNKNSLMLVDKLCHASIYDGIRLANTHYRRYRHNDAQHLRQHLQKQPDIQPYVISESIFSMQGNIADIPQLLEQTKIHQAKLIIDDAHGFGILGKNGKGVCEHFHIDPNDLHCLVVPMGKAFGSMGAMVLGSHTCIESLIQFARSYIYTTALPTSVVNANLVALNILTQEHWRRERLRTLIKTFNDIAYELELPIVSTDITPIRCMHIGSNATCIHIQTQLMHAGLLVSCIRPPSVPVNSACLRISLNTYHTSKQIRHLLTAIKTHSLFHNKTR